MLQILPIQKLAIYGLLVWTVLVYSTSQLNCFNIDFDLITLARGVPFFIAGYAAFLAVAWRWKLSDFGWIFSYLGGQWSGKVVFERAGKTEERDVELDIRHNLFSIKLLLESNESTSYTLMAGAERDKDFSKHRIYYVYQNERRDGSTGKTLDSYRGCATLGIKAGTKIRLEGNYFTEQEDGGMISLERIRRHHWWTPWC